MLYVGLDVHVKHITICVLNKNGKLLQRCQLPCLDDVIQFLMNLRGRCEVCFEASTGYGIYFEALSKIASRVAVAHPGLLKLIFRSKQKNDRADAEKLAKLLFLDEVPTVHVPTADVRAWRELITFRGKLIQKRTRAKNGIRSLLRSVGCRVPKEFGLWTIRGMEWLKQKDLKQPMQNLKRNMLEEEIETLTRQTRLVETELARYSKENIAVQQLQSIPGIGLRTAEAFVAFVDDPHRFANSKKVGAYFGLIPIQDQSGSTNRLGHITREGCAEVRHLVTEAVWQGIRYSPTIKAYYERIHRHEKDRKKIAIVATSHYLVRVMWSMLKNGTLWKERSLAV